MPCMYIMAGWSPVMYDLMHVCMLACLECYFMPIVITVVQGCNFGAMANDHLQGVISLKVPKHDEEHK